MAWVSELPSELLKEQKFGLYVENPLEESIQDNLSLVIKMTVNADLEPKWTVVPRNKDVEEKQISAADRALIGVNFIGDYTDTQFAYNRQSPLYALTKQCLVENQDLERIKVKLLRSMSSNINDEHFEPFNGPLANLKEKAVSLGLSIDELCANIDIKENPYTGNSIALHYNELPYRLQGKGSKRLMSIAIQSELTKAGGIMLVDEIEQGLEPDRIITLVRILSETNSGQVFITTHSLNVVLEAKANNLFVLNKNAHELCQLRAELDACRRSNPQSLFAKKIICCEGKTEYGFIRAIDSWLEKSEHFNLSSKGVVLVDAKGGDQMFTFAVGLKSLGFNVCIFADNDKPKELEDKINLANQNNIPLFLCDEGNCLEAQIIHDMPWPLVKEMTECSQVDFPSANIEISDELKDQLATTVLEEQISLRKHILELCIKKKHEWFKHIPGGEYLGGLIIENLPVFQHDATIRKNIEGLIKWLK